MNQVPDNLGIPDWEFRVVFGRTTIDYDIEKEYSNREKHGYSLESAVALLESIILNFDGKPCMTSHGFMVRDEIRHMHMTIDDCGKIVVVVTTMRPLEIVRIISYRRASAHERDEFAATTGFHEN